MESGDLILDKDIDITSCHVLPLLSPVTAIPLSTAHETSVASEVRD
jgi:hypothetical protein